MATLISMQLPAIARQLKVVEIDLLTVVKTLKDRNQHTTYNYWNFIGLPYGQARTALAKLKAAGLVTSTEVRSGSNILGLLWDLTQQGRELLEKYTSLMQPAKRKAPPTDSGHADSDGLSVGQPDLYADMSAHGKDRLRAELQGPIHERVVDQLREGSVPDAEQLIAWGVRELVAREIAAGAARLAAKRANNTSMTTPDSDTGATRVAAATAEDVERARRAGVPVPVIKAGEGENAGAIAQAAQLLINEAAARRPDLLRRGTLLARLPQMVWAMLQGAVSEYGAMLKRARALLRWLAEDRFEVPKGYEPQAGVEIRARLCISESVLTPSVGSEQLFKSRMYKTYSWKASAASAQGLAA